MPMWQPKLPRYHARPLAGPSMAKVLAGDFATCTADACSQTTKPPRHLIRPGGVASKAYLIPSRGNRASAHRSPLSQ